VIFSNIYRFQSQGKVRYLVEHVFYDVSVTAQFDRVHQGVL